MTYDNCRTLFLHYPSTASSRQVPMTPETPAQRARREQQRARREHVEKNGVHNAEEAVKHGYGACKKCQCTCTKFIAGGGDDVSCGGTELSGQQRLRLDGRRQVVARVRIRR